MTPAKRREFFARLKRANPTPTTELKYTTPFELLVSVILSAQATDTSVNKATAALFKLARTPQAMLALGPRGLKRHIKTIGLFRNKARAVIAMSQQLIAEHGGQVPASREALEKLPGVGRKTANVVLNSAFGKPTKPIGPFFSEGRARRLARARGWDVVEDAGRGWRRDRLGAFP